MWCGTERLTDVAERIDDGDRHGTLCAGAREAARVPREENVEVAAGVEQCQPRKGSRSLWPVCLCTTERYAPMKSRQHEEDRKVPSRDVGGRSGNDKAKHAEHEWDAEVEAALGLAVGQPGEDERENGGDNVRWSSEEQGVDPVELERLDHRGHELRGRKEGRARSVLHVEWRAGRSLHT